MTCARSCSRAWAAQAGPACRWRSRSFILNRVDVNHEMKDISVPSLFVASDDRGDWSPADAAAAADRTPGAQVATIVGARTFVPLEQPKALAALVQNFWEQQ